MTGTARQRLQQAVSHTPLGRLVTRLQLVRYLRLPRDWWILRQGRYRVRLLGQDLTFVVSSQTELMRIDDFVWERPLVERIAASLEPGDTFYDVGANIGVVSLVVYRVASDRGVRVEAFEPEPRNAQRLAENIEANGATGVRSHRLALGATEGRSRFLVSGDVGAGAHSLAGAEADGPAAIEVDVVPATRFAERQGHEPRVVKVDVEGAEMDVLRGLDGLLARGVVRDLFIEIHPEPLRRRGVDPAAIASLLASHGYRLAWEDERVSEIHHHYRRAGS